jgi:endothelin-converting enzyme
MHVSSMLIDDIATVEVFKNSLRTLDWMDKESALAAAQKASNTEIEVGYPLSPDTRDAEAIFRYYEAIEIDENDFFGNMLSSR